MNTYYQRFKSTEDRFLERVNLLGPVHPNLGTRCWQWTGRTIVGGYGQFSLSHVRNVSAHRFSYELFVGPIPDELCVLHKCDKPQCVNPAHLFLGTNMDNNRDMFAKGRANKAVGESIGSAKMTEQGVRRMRQLYRVPGVSQRLLAQEFDVHVMTVNAIVCGRSWRHVV